MKVRLRINGDLAKQANLGSEELEVEPGSTIEDLLAGLGLEMKRQYLFVVDKKLVRKDFVLYEGASVALFPFVSGG